MPFDDWNDVSKDHLELPINGRVYRIPPVGYLDAIRIEDGKNAVRELMTLQAEDEPDDEKIAAARARCLGNEEYLQMILGPALQQMRADNVPEAAIVHASVVVNVDYTEGRGVAEYVWKHGMDPEALAAQMAAIQTAVRQAQTEIRSTTSPSTASESPTPTPASTAPTTSPKASSRKKPAKRSTSGPSSKRGNA